MQKKCFMLVFLALAATLGAQVPKAINYQAIIKNDKKEPVTDPSLSVRVQILKDAPSGAVVFEETHKGLAATDGAVGFPLGAANPAGFAALDWSSGPYFLKIDYDLDNGTAFSNTDAVQILAVPIALYAEKAGSSGDWINLGDTVLFSKNRLIAGGDLQKVSLTHKSDGISISNNLRVGPRIHPGGNGTENGYSLVHFKNGTAQKGGIIRASIGNNDGPDAPMSYESTSHSFLGPLAILNPWPSLTMKSTTSGKTLYWEMNADGTYYLFDPQAQRYRILFTGNGVGIGTSDPKYTLDVNGSAQVRCLSIAGGCDIIEQTNSTETLLPGEVVVIDPSRPNHVRRCNKAYDRLSIGVVSGAGGITHGMMLSQEGVLDGNVSFAIAGRVKVKVTGGVQPGDLLTTSSIPGCAMAAKSRHKRDGAVIGKALGAPDGEGLVLMLVTMQ